MPKACEVSDKRIDDLLAFVGPAEDGFANNLLWRSEIASLLAEVKRTRDRPLHCPCCDGDHE